MKICHLIDHMGLGGAQKMVLDLVEGRGSAIEPSVISLRASARPDAVDRLRNSGAHYRTLNLTKANPLGFLRLRKALKEAEADLLHVHLDYSNTFGTAAARSLGRQRPILLNHIHDHPRRRPASWYRLGLAAVAPFVDAHVVSTSGVAAATAKALWHRPRRIEVIAPGVDLDVFSADQCAESAVRTLRGNAKRVVGAVARLAPQKAIHSALEAMPYLLAEEPSTRLLIVGDGPLRAALEQQCERLQVSGCVRFLGYLADVRPAYAAMDILVMPSRHEGFGIALIEAMAMNVSVVATKVGGIEDVVADGRTGLLVPYDDPAALAASIVRLFDDPGLRTRFLAAARQAVEERYSRQRMVGDIESLYENLIAHARPANRQS